MTTTAESFRAFRAVTDGEAVDRGVVTMAADDLPADGALVEVHWSSVNYKDGLAATPAGKVARISPIVPGIDLAGVLVEDTPGLPAGSAVLAHGYAIGVARHGIAHDRMADRAQVHADLMRAAGRDGDLQQRDALEVTGPGDARHRAPRPPRPRRHLLPVLLVPADGGIDPSSGLDDAPDERDVLLFDLAVAKLTRELLVRAIVLGDDHQARGATIQPVHDAWAEARRRCRSGR